MSNRRAEPGRRPGGSRAATVAGACASARQCTPIQRGRGLGHDADGVGKGQGSERPVPVGAASESAEMLSTSGEARKASSPAGETSSATAAMAEYSRVSRNPSVGRMARSCARAAARAAGSFEGLRNRTMTRANAGVGVDRGSARARGGNAQAASRRAAGQASRRPVFVRRRKFPASLRARTGSGRSRHPRSDGCRYRCSNRP